MKPFANEPVLELRRPAVRDALPEALASLDSRLPLEVPLLIGADSHFREGELTSVDPCSPERVVARAAVAGDADVGQAVRAGLAAGELWAARPVAERADVLLRAGEWMRDRRLELAALQVRECAKPWREADADVCEAIDYLEYYAREALALDALRLLQAPGERNALRWNGRGVCAVIAPWNFPLAIPCGMTSAALVMGNAAVLKPAEQSPGSALMLCRAFEAAGLPAGVLSLLPGLGSVGAAIVRHPGVATIAFTGSVAVGKEIWRTAAATPLDRGGFKRVVAELGGKNCVIVDSDADLDEVVPALVSSAFGYAGQKCSAASRALVHEAIYSDLERRLKGAVKTLVVGNADDLATQVPAVIEAEAVERVRRYAAEGRAVARADAELPSEGFFCAPTVIADLAPDAPTLREEVFGPLLTLEQVPSVTEAVEIVRALPFALTGGLFSRNPATVAEAVQSLPVGNLYVNRAITGAMVGRQPFGGNRQSGTGMHAGGPAYLEQFADQQVISENTTRHGLAI